MGLVYTDTSAIVKLILDEPRSEALRNFIEGADLLSYELVLSRCRALFAERRIVTRAYHSIC